MRKRFLPLVLAAAALGLVPSGVRAYDTGNFCVSGFQACFDVTVTGSVFTHWTVTVNYLTTGSAPGILTGVDLYGSPNFTGLVPGTASGTGSWAVVAGSDPKCSDLGFGNQQVCAESNSPPTGNGISAGQSFSFTFTNLTPDVAAGMGTNYFVGGHIQGYNNTTCSLKFGTSFAGNLAAGPSDPGACGSTPPPPTTVPEPVSMVLLGSGLLALAIPASRLRRRRKDKEDA